jgi:hypothetical protein
LINQSTMSNPTTGHNNQLTLGNDGCHQQPACIAKVQTQITNGATTAPCGDRHTAPHSTGHGEDA